MRKRTQQYSFAVIFAMLVSGVAASATTAYADKNVKDYQACTAASAGAGQPVTLVCKSTVTGALTQSIPAGTNFGAGGIGGALARSGNKVLITDLVEGAMLFSESGGQLKKATLLVTGAGSISGALSEDGAYVLTGTQVMFFPRGSSKPSSSAGLLRGDGSAAQVVTTNDYAYVAEKNGSLEAFSLGPDGNIVGPATAVNGVPAGVIVGIASLNGQVIAPIAHLAITDGSSIPVVGGLSTTKVLPTRERAACWAAADDGEVCITNPGTMSVSCGRFGRNGFESFTAIAIALPGETLIDIDIRDGAVVIVGKDKGAQVFFTLERDGDFLSLTGKYPVGATTATGALIISPLVK